MFEDRGAEALSPLTRARAVHEIRVGPETVLERLERLLQVRATGVCVRLALADATATRDLRPINPRTRAGDLVINARWRPDGRVALPRDAHVAHRDGELAHARLDDRAASEFETIVAEGRGEALMHAVAHLPRIEAAGRMIRHPWDMIASLKNDLVEALSFSRRRPTARSRRGVTIVKPARTHIAADCAFQGPCTLDATDGPILIERGVRVGAYAILEGPAYIGRGSRINPHTWLHGANAVGPVCKLGGEIDGCIFQGFSNKQHAGFLGHSWIGSWVNLGAGTTNSDLKNTYGTVRVRRSGDEIDTGQMFFGAVIADHVKTGIGTLLPTGAVLDFAAVAATGGLLPSYVPPFSWLTGDGMRAGDPRKLLDIARKMMSRRGIEMSEADAAGFLRLAAELGARR
ncbi:MAG: hypothetical protein FLDDKLPJ_00893 [Phycisphaerae bacterium]|nr:hypothetical protein [Phycisphaerae bacterium]